MGWRGVQLFFVGAVFVSSATAVLAEPIIGRVYTLDLTDVDGDKLTTADGHVTVIVISRPNELDKPRLVGERIPQYCVGNPAYRLITLVSFQKRQSGPARVIASMVARRRLDSEAKKLRPRYLEKKLTRDPRRDVFAVLDFDGKAAANLGVETGSPTFQVLILDTRGQLLKRWTNVPTSEELAAVLNQTVP